MNKVDNFQNHFQHEQTILTIFLHSSQIRADKMSFVHASDFLDPRHVHLFEFLNELFLKYNNRFDVQFVLTKLQNSQPLKLCGGNQYLLQLIDLYTTDSLFMQYYEILIQQSVKRKLAVLFQTQQKKLQATENPEKIFKDLYLQLTELENNYLRNEETFVSIAELINKTYQNLKRQKSLHDENAFSTGFAELDQKTNGFQPGELIILAGRPSMGKTALALNLIFNDFFLNQNVNYKTAGDVIFFSLEMSPQQLSQRILKTYIDLAPNFFQSDQNDDKIQDLIQNLAKSNIFIDTSTGIDILRIHAKLRKWIKTRKIRMIVIDYLQLLKPIYNRRFENRNLEIAFWTRHLKEMAIEFNIPILCLSQLSRNVERRETKRPLLSDLRDSGSIEQDADVVLFLYREEYYLKDNSTDPDKKPYNYNQPQKAEIIIAKQRNGPTGKIEVLFLPNKTAFMDYSDEK